MVEHSRYNTGNNKNGVLKNKLGIINQKTLDDVETLLLKDTYIHFFTLLQAGKLKFSTKIIFEIHKYFLNIIYSWAGKIRTVEISKNGILFCASLQIKKTFEDFNKILKKNIPISTDNKKIISKKLAVIHCEFNAIHPFREANGRTIRLFLDLLAVNIGYGLIDYSKILKANYIKACIAGMRKDYSKIQKILYKGLSKDKN